MGCQMNEYDSDLIARTLVSEGYVQLKEPQSADLLIVNTCTVRAKPEQKAYSMLGRMSAIKKKRPEIKMAVIGCLAQEKGAGLIKRFPMLDLVMGPRQIDRFKGSLRLLEMGGNPIVATDSKGLPPIPPTHASSYFKGRTSGQISIMEGCNNFCSYCIVPYVRGREVSRSPDSILEEAVGLVSQDVRDITLLGQNVNSYSWNEGENYDFPSLLKLLSGVEGLLRLRFTTSHPKDLSDELIKCFGKLENLCAHIHLPFQAGSNKVLYEMRRRYTREDYLLLIEKLRMANPFIAITSDVMVGFPGEDDNDFQDTLDLVRSVRFDGLFSFKYSDRKGTLAEKMEKKVSEAEKSSRLEVLQSLQKQITLEKNSQLKDKVVAVLVEGKSKRGDQMSGRTSSNKIVNFNSNNNIINTIVKVKIKSAFVNSLRGELV